MDISKEKEVPILLEEKDIYNYLEDLKRQLQKSSRQKKATIHFELAQKLNQEDYQQSACQIINTPTGFDLIKSLIASIDYPLIYSNHHQFELAYFYKSIPNLCKVSVVIPMYNAEEHLVECLDSVIKQTWKNIEIICVNDGSTDESLTLLKQYQKKDPRIIICNNEINAGLSQARNIGIQNCNSEYVMCIDSDDWIPQTAIEHMYQSIIAPEIDWVIGSIKIYENTEVDSLEKSYKEEYMRKFSHETGIYNVPMDIGHSLQTSAWGKLYKLSIILQNHLKFPIGLIHEDQSWVWEYGIHCRKLFYLNEPIYVYRINHSSLTHNSEKLGRFLKDLVSVHIYLYKKLSKKVNIKEYRHYLTPFFVSKIYFSAEKNGFKINSRVYSLFKKYRRLNPLLKDWIFLSKKRFNNNLKFARIDLINTGNRDNSVSIVTTNMVTNHEKIVTPEGTGCIIQQLPHKFCFTAIANGNGNLKIELKSQNIWKEKIASVIFQSVHVNGKRILNKEVEISSENCLEFTRPVHDGEKLFFKIKYKATDKSYEALKNKQDFFELTIKDRPVLYVRRLIE